VHFRGTNSEQIDNARINPSHLERFSQSEVTARRTVNVRKFPRFQIENRPINKKVMAFLLKG
jgi:hypothetical protein